MKKSTIIAVGVAALVLGAAGYAIMPSGSDRIREGCFLGDLVYETRDGSVGFDEGACAPEPQPVQQYEVLDRWSDHEGGDIMPVMVE